MYPVISCPKELVGMLCRKASGCTRIRGQETIWKIKSLLLKRCIGCTVYTHSGCWVSCDCWSWKRSKLATFGKRFKWCHRHSSCHRKHHTVIFLFQVCITVFSDPPFAVHHHHCSTQKMSADQMICECHVPIIILKSPCLYKKTLNIDSLVM